MFGKLKIGLSGIKASIVFIVVGLMIATGSHRMVYHMFVPQDMKIHEVKQETEIKKIVKPSKKASKKDEVQFSPLENKSVTQETKKTNPWAILTILYNYVDIFTGIGSGLIGLYNLTKKFRKKKVEDWSD
jgi:hypothetical protein